MHLSELWYGLTHGTQFTIAPMWWFIIGLPIILWEGLGWTWRLPRLSDYLGRHRRVLSTLVLVITSILLAHFNGVLGKLV